MKKTLFHCGVLAVLFGGAAAHAGVVPATPAGEPVVPGEWHLSLSKTLDTAFATGIPVVAFWSDPDCSKCDTVIRQVVDTPAFTAWRQERKLLFVTGNGKDRGDDGVELYNWVKQAAQWDGDNTYPFIRVWWRDRNGTVQADARFSGWRYHEGPQALIDKIESYVAEFTYYDRVRFGCPETGMEVEPGADNILIPLRWKRSWTMYYGMKSVGNYIWVGPYSPPVNTLFVTRTLPGGGTTNWTQTVTWNDSDSWFWWYHEDGSVTQMANIPVEGHYPGGTITATLSATNQPDETVVIDMVEMRPVSTLNPRFIGEPFDYGEWTMDLDAAINRVAGEAGEAYTLVAFFGALWCPYCHGLEEGVLDTEAFREFARTNKIALVEIDNPRRDGTPPTLLRYDVDAARTGLSGAGYLSRHGIAMEDAEAALARNAALQAAWTLPGAARIGYPTLVLLRKNGSVAGRFNGVYRAEGAGVYTYDTEVNLLRMAEFLALARDPLENGEELNNLAARTGETLDAEGGQRSASLRAMDTADVYRLLPEPGARPVITVQGPLDAAVTLSLLDAAGQMVQTQGGSLAAGVTLTVQTASTGAVYVAVAAGGAAVAGTNLASTVRAYTVSSTQIKEPGVVEFVSAAVAVAQSATNAAVALRRRDGNYGTYTVTVKLNATGGTTAVAGEDFVDVFGAAGVTVSWAPGESGVKTVNVPLLPRNANELDKTVALSVAEYTAEGDPFEPAAPVWACLLTIKGSDWPFFAEEAVTVEARTRVALDATVAVVNTTGGRVTVAKTSGALPAGIKAAYDAAAGALRLTGVSSKTGEYTAAFQVSERRGSKTVKGGTVAVTVTVGELSGVNPAAAQAVPAAEGPVIDPATRRVTGVVRLSVSKTGRITAKYRGMDGTKSFSANAWSQILESGRVEAFLPIKTHLLAVAMEPDGAFQGYLLSAPGGVPKQQEVQLVAVPWTKDAPAAAYQGYYTASLSPVERQGAWAPEGYSTLTLSLSAAAARSGTVKFAGTLADGTAYSGSALLAPYTDEAGEQAHVPVYAKTGRATFGALLAVDAYAAETYQEWPSAVSACGDTVPYWTKADTYEETSFDVALDICGGYYNPADSLAGHWEKYEELFGPFQLRADGELPVSMYGTATNLPLVDLAVTEKTLKIPARGVNPTKATLTLNKTTGIVKGTFKIPFVNGAGKVQTVTATYSGVLLPGWTGDCGCSDDGAELPEKPFAMGSFYFSDKAAVAVSGRNKTVTFKQGHPIIIKKAAEAAEP